MLENLIIGRLVAHIHLLLILANQEVGNDVIALDFVVHLVLVEHGVRPGLERDLNEGIVAAQVELEHLLEDGLVAGSVDPVLPVIAFWVLVVVVNLLQKLIDFDEVFCRFLGFVWVAWERSAFVIVAKAVDIFWLVVKQAWSGAVNGHIQLAVLPQKQVVSPLSHPALGIEYVNHGRSKRPISLVPIQVVNCNPHLGIGSEVTNLDWKFDFRIQLVRGDYAGLHLRLERLVVEPELGHNHDLQADVDVLHLVPLVLGEVILDVLPVDVVEFANLIEGVHAYLFEPLPVLHLRQQPKLIVQIPDEVKLQPQLLVVNFTMPDEDRFVGRMGMHRLGELRVCPAYLRDARVAGRLALRLVPGVLSPLLDLGVDPRVELSNLLDNEVVVLSSDVVLGFVFTHVLFLDEHLSNLNYLSRKYYKFDRI